MCFPHPPAATLSSLINASHCWLVAVLLEMYPDFAAFTALAIYHTLSWEIDPVGPWNVDGVR